MNRIDLTQQGGFPLTQDTLDFMQAAYGESLKALTMLLGDKVVITGCEVNNGVVSPGLVAVGGEILPTAGGAADAVFVSESEQSAYFEDGMHRAVYFRRTLVFGVGDPQYSWGTFRRLSKIVDIAGVPSGIIVMWYGLSSEAPAGWKICDGTAGTPDLRGKFVIGTSSQYSHRSAGGEATHTLTSAETPVHRHFAAVWGIAPPESAGPVGDQSITTRRNYYNSNDVWQTSSAYVLGATDSTPNTARTSSFGGGAAHNNLPPYMALHFIMKI